MHDADSSSAKDNSFFIADICSTSSGLIKVVNSEGVSFFSRPEYFFNSDLEQLKKEKESFIHEDLLSKFLVVVRAYSAELEARNYLGRAEHSRFQLYRKLIKKKFSGVEINLALDYLENKKILDDVRFAGAWVRTRSILKKEGRLRLASELFSRGIDFNIASKALDEFFSENSEELICKKALEKQIAKGFEGDKLFRTMARLGFPLQLINICLEEQKNNCC